jgi:hypothetical protein
VRRSRSTVPFRITRRGSGFAAWGPGFYVWDEDPRELVRQAAAFSRARSTREPRGAALRARRVP